MRNGVKGTWGIRFKQTCLWGGAACLATICLGRTLAAQSAPTPAPEAKLHEYLSARAANRDFSGEVSPDADRPQQL